MNREILGDILKRMADDGQPQENIGKVAEHYNAMMATIEKKEDPNNEHKNADGTWRTPEQIWEELQAGKEGGSQTNDATVEPQVASGGTESASGDGSLESQEVQPNQIIEQGGYEYKFDWDEEGKPVYLTKRPSSKKWIKVDPKIKDGQITNPAYASIGQEFGHFSKEAFDRDAYLKNKATREAALNEIEEKKNNPQSLDDMGLTKEGYTFVRNEDRFVMVDGEWYKQPINGLPLGTAEGYHGKPMGDEFKNRLMNVLDTPTKQSMGISTTLDEKKQYLYNPYYDKFGNYNGPTLMDMGINTVEMVKDQRKRNEWWAGGLDSKEQYKVNKLNEDDDFDWRNTKTWVNKNEATVRENIEANFPGVNVEEYGVGNAVKINVPWQEDPYIVDLVPGGDVNDPSSKFNKQRRILEEFAQKHNEQGDKINNSLGAILGERQTMDSTKLSNDGIDGANKIFKEAGLGYSIKKNLDDYGLVHQSYTLSTPNGDVVVRNANAMTKWFYDNLSPEDYDKIDDVELGKRTKGIKVKENKIKQVKREIPDEEVEKDWWTKGEGTKSVIFDLDQDPAFSDEAKVLIKKSLDTPIQEEKMVPNVYATYEGAPTMVKGLVTVDGWEKKRYNQLLTDMKGKISNEEYTALEKYLSSTGAMTKERLNDQKNVIANRKGDLAYETYVGHDSNIDVRVGAKDLINKQVKQIQRERKDLDAGYLHMINVQKDDGAKLERRFNNIQLNMKRDGCGVQVYGEGDDQTVVVSHPDPEKQKYYQTKLEGLLDQSRTLKNSGEKAASEYDVKIQNWKETHLDNIKDNEKLQHLVNKEYDSEKVVWQDFFDGFRSFGYNIPAAFGNDWSIEQADNFNKAKSSFQTKLTMDEAREFGQVGFTSWRTFNQQAGNMVIATASSFIVPGGAVLGISGATLATASAYGLSSAGGKRVDLLGRNERADKAKVQLNELEEHYKNGNIGYDEYKKQAIQLQSTISLGGISSRDINISSAWSGVTEGGVMLVAGTAVNAMKFKGLMSGAFTSNAGDQLTRGIGGRLLNFTAGTTGMIGSELVEEFSALGLDKLGDAYILGDDVWEDLPGELKETFFSTIISSGPMSGLGNAYSNVISHVTNSQARNQWFNEIKPEIGKIDNAINNLDPNSGKYQSDLKFLQDAKIEQIRKVVKLSQEAEIDALALGPDAVQEIMVSNKNLQGLYAEAGVTTGMSETEIEKTVNEYIEKLPGGIFNSEKSDFKKKLDIAKGNIAKQRSSIDYGNDKTAHTVEYNNDGSVKSEGVIHKMFGEEGVAMAEKIIAKDPKFLELSAKDKAIAVNEALKEKRDTKEVNKLKKDTKMKESIEKEVYTDNDGNGITKEEWKILNNKKRVPTDLKNQEDALYNTVGQYANARKGEALVLANEGMVSAASMLQDQSLAGLEINEANGLSDLKQKVYQAVNDGLITEEKADEIIQGISDGKVKAAILGNKYITTEINATQSAVAQGNLLAGTAISHEIGHFIDDTAMNDSQRESYAGHLNEYMTENMPAVHQAAIDRNSKFKDDSRYIADIPFENQTPQAKDEYTKSVQDELRQNKNKKYLNKVKKQSQTGFMNRMRGIKGGDFKINNKNDAAAWMGSYLTGFEKGEVGELQKRKLKNAENNEDRTREGYRTSSDLQNQLEQRSVDEQGQQRTPTKADAEKMALDMLSQTPTGDIANGILDSELANQIGGIVENITKKLYDPIAPDARNGVTRNQFKETAVVKGWELMSKEYLKGPKTMALDGYMSFLLNERSKDIAKELGIESTAEYGGRGIDVKIDDAKGIESDLTAEDAFNEEVENITNPELPLSENLDVSNTDQQAILEQALIDVGVKLPAVDVEISKNKFTTPLISALKKAFGVKNGIIHKAMLNTIGKTKSEVEAFLVNPKNKLSILRSMPTSWLAKNIPSAVQKSVGGTRVKNGDGTTTFTPNWTSDWQGKKIDRWNAADVGPYRGNTSGPQVMKRNPSPSSTTNAEMLSLFARGETMTDIRRNGLDKLAIAMGQEYGLETFKNDLNNDGPMSKVFKGRQDLFDRVLAENYVEEIGRQIQRGTVKFSNDSETLVNNLVGDALNQELDNMLRDVITNVPAGGIKTDKEMDQLLKGYHPHLVNAFKQTGIYDMFGKTKGFIQLTKDMDYPAEFDWLKKEYNENAHSNLKDQKESLNNITNVLIDRIPGELLDKMGYSFFGLNNPRVLDGAEKKRSTGLPGEFFPTRQKLQNKQGKKTAGLDLNFDPNGVELMNSKIGLMKDVQDILNLDIPAEDKKIKLRALQPRIDAANANNKKMLKYLVGQIALAVESDPSLASGALALYQSAGNNVNGFRALTDLSMIKVMDGSQAPFVTAKGKPTMTNTGLVNRAHPDYKRAYDMAGGDLSVVGKLLNSKGEHIDPSAPIQSRIAQKTLQLASNLKGVTDVDTRNQILLEHNNEMDLLLATFDQTLGPVIDSDIQDNRLGKTSQLGYARNFAIPSQLKNYVDTKQGGTGTDLINDQTIGLVQRLSQQDRIDIKNIDKAKENVRLSQGESRGMSAFDFDETLIDGGDNQIVATKDGETVIITSAEWPILGPKYAAEGFDFNFDDFINVKGGVEGPLMQKFRNRINKYGIENNYILTARPQEAAPAIQAWLQQQGIEMPIENITGLGNSTGEAKAQWMLGKFAEGYNDMYFVDDALPNVEAVQNVIDQLDIKGKAAQVRLSQGDPSSEFNQILEDVFDVGKDKQFSEAKAKQRGENKGRFRIFIPPSAEDFKGLIYNFLGRGKAGEAHFKFFKENLIDPYAKAQRAVDKAQAALTNDYRTVKKAHKPIVKKLNKKLPGTEFTYDQGIRVLLWDRAGYDIPGLSVTDKNKILSAIKKEPGVIAFANDLSLTTKQENGYSKPGEFWITESIGSDLNNLVQKIGRDQFLEPFKEKRRQIFGEWKGKKLVGPNINKIESIFGVRFKEALTDMLWRMENGSNRSFGDNRLVNAFANWVNNSVGAIMFFNARSAVLQTLSTVNFINFGDNNIFKASKAFANQPQFWKDFSMLFNSDMLKQRRSGLKTDINQNELAQVAQKAKGNPKAVLQHLLRLGFLPTQIADSFAISMGGASFYRNRLDALVKQGMSKAEAEKQAFIDFQEKAEETQQSSRPDLISQQQASALGRLVLAFQNTPMQYARLTKKAALDLINRRGSDRQNISKILYYGAVQNMIFSSLQQAMFKYMFDDEEEEGAKRTSTMRVGNSMLDGFLRGTGVYGAIASTLKNMVLKFMDEDKKKGNADFARVLVEGLNLSPPIGSKSRKLYSGLTTYKYNKDEMYEMDKLSIDNPMYQTIGNTVSAITNFPLDRIVNKTNNIRQAMNQNNEAWQRVGLSLGWNSWDLGVENEALKESSIRVKKAKELERKKKQDIKKAEERKQKEKERKEREAREVQCSAKKRKGKGERCKNRTENKSGKCYAHQ